MYYPTDGIETVWLPMPLTGALGYYMGLRPSGGGREQQSLERLTKSQDAFIRFGCPSQPWESVTPAYTLSDDVNNRYGVKAWMGYVFNGGMLARRIRPWGETPAGQVSRVRHPSDVFLFADGNSVGELSWQGYGVHPQDGPQDTFENCPWPGQVDRPRHRGRINVVFVDGHAETLRLPVSGWRDLPGANSEGLKRIGVTKGIFD